MIFRKNLFNKYNIDSDLQSKFLSAAEKVIGELYTTAFIMTSNNKGAAKLIEKCFNDAVKFLNHLDERIEIEGWLFRILINKMKKKYSLNIDEIIYQEIETKFENILDSISSIEEIEDKINSIDSNKLRTLVSNLPAGLKLALLLKDILNRNYEEVSDIIDIPVDISALRINYARKLIFISGVFQKENITSGKNSFDPGTELMIAKFVDEELNDDAQKSGIKNKLEENKKLEMNFEIQKKIKELILKNVNEFSIADKVKNKLCNY